jgi:hypothetical protein
LVTRLRYWPLIGGIVRVDLVDCFVLKEPGEVVEDGEKNDDEDVKIAIQDAPLKK